jgi:ferrochelatase
MAEDSDQTGVLLINVGTPDAPEPAAVRRFLRQFLSDPRVMDIGPLSRWLLLNLVILPRRSAKSAAAYGKIWTEDGSPILVHGRALARKAQTALGERFTVKLAMRYGQPSIVSALTELRGRGINRLVVLPLLPQHASATTGSVLEELHRAIRETHDAASLCVVPPFFDHPRYIDALAANARPALDEFGPEHVLLSFHGLPERHVRRGDESGARCLETDACCDRIDAGNRQCYRAQCYETARGLAEKLGLGPERHSVAFQSRIGKSPWIGPHTDARVREMARGRVRRLAVICPGFVADCLETLEEIGVRARDEFVAQGGDALLLVPCLNDDDAWVDAVAYMVRTAV